jgi:hypothetical protein
LFDVCYFFVFLFKLLKCLLALGLLVYYNFFLRCSFTTTLSNLDFFYFILYFTFVSLADIPLHIFNPHFWTIIPYNNILWVHVFQRTRVLILALIKLLISISVFFWFRYALFTQMHFKQISI